MELSRKKIIFFSIAWFIWVLLFVMLLIMFLNQNNKTSVNSWTWDFKIWMVWDEPSDEFAEWFKKFANTWKNIVFESFDTYENYSLALTRAITLWQAPDIFVLNANEKTSIFEGQTVWISPKILNPTEFKKYYHTFITDQLVWVDEKNSEYIKWIPVWFEALWIFYNKTQVSAREIESMENIYSAITRLKERYSDSIPLAIGNWTTVPYSVDIATQFILSQWWNRSIENIEKTNIQKWLAIYYDFWDITSTNAYNSRLSEMNLARQTSVDLFSNGDTFMIVWYPRLINKILEKWFRKNFLFAWVLPTEVSIANYNYFVMNKDTKNPELAEKFMTYLVSWDWLNRYFSAYPYYIPTMNTFEENLKTQKIHPDANILIWDFYSDTTIYTTFDKWIKNIYDLEVEKLLDKETLIEDFIRLQSVLNCKTKKILNFTELLKSCE